jgi:hypothetical protein
LLVATLGITLSALLLARSASHWGAASMSADDFSGSRLTWPMPLIEEQLEHTLLNAHLSVRHRATRLAIRAPRLDASSSLFLRVPSGYGRATVRLATSGRATFF